MSPVAVYGQARGQAEYENIGREALAALLLPGGPDGVNNARRLPLTDDVTWQAMQEGPTTFGVLVGAKGFNNRPQGRLGAEMDSGAPRRRAGL